MSMIKTSIIWIRLLRPVFHAISIALAFVWAYVIRQETGLFPYERYAIPPANGVETLVFGILSIVIFVGIGMQGGLYELQKPIHGYLRQYSRVRLIRLVSITFLAYFGQWFLFYDGISRFIIIVGSWMSFMLMLWCDAILNRINRLLEKKYPYRILIISRDQLSFQQLIDEIKRSSIYEYTQTLLDHYTKSQLLKHDMIIIVGTIDSEKLQIIFDDARLSGKKFFHIAEGFFIDDIIYQTASIWWITAFEYKSSTLDGRAVVLKRIFDVCVSATFLILAFWVYVMIILYIRYHDSGPVFYTSQRIWRGGKPFAMLKFRTMIKNADVLKHELLDRSDRKGPLFKMDNDPRITARGRFLRKRSLDELPQVRNVLMWSMSIVWPRPHIHAEVSQYKSRQKRLLSIKPGMTGYAQIFGRDSLNFDQEATLDLQYIQNRSIFLDMYIIVSTIWILWKGR